jgi:hypothetical protein
MKNQLMMWEASCYFAAAIMISFHMNRTTVRFIKDWQAFSQISMYE